MTVSVVRRGCLALASTLILMLSAGSAYANCASAPVFHGFTSSFEQCGPAAAVFFWHHGRAVQRILSTIGNGQTPSIAGVDSGLNQTLSQGVMTEGPNGAANGSYFGNTDFANGGSDGCILVVQENPTTC